MKTRTLIVDDHPLIREGLKKIIESSDDLCVAGEAENGVQALERISEKNLDVIVLDMNMPILDGREVLKQLRADNNTTPVLAFSIHKDTYFTLNIMREGAAGYLTKAASKEELLKAIRAVAAGRRYIAGDLAGELAGFISDNVWQYPVDTLSPREKSVLSYLSRGLSARDIARKMNLSIKTINTYRSKICNKLHFRTSTELVQFALSQKS